MDMMMEMTSQQTHKQFIFLTPQGLSQLSMKMTGRPKIFEMLDPDRAKGQTTLNFQRHDEEDEDD